MQLPQRCAHAFGFIVTATNFLCFRSAGGPFSAQGGICACVLGVRCGGGGGRGVQESVVPWLCCGLACQDMGRRLLIGTHSYCCVATWLMCLRVLLPDDCAVEATL